MRIHKCQTEDQKYWEKSLDQCPFKPGVGPRAFVASVAQLVEYRIDYLGEMRSNHRGEDFLPESEQVVPDKPRLSLTLASAGVGGGATPPPMSISGIAAEPLCGSR